jgi:hypothetical protein
MPRTVIAVLLVLIAVLSADSGLMACGDKFLVASRGTRFQRPPAPRVPANILFYANPASELARRLDTLSLVDALRKIGYQPTIAATRQDFAAAFNQRPWDLVVVDVADIGMVADPNRAGEAPRVVPVTYTMTGPEWNQARRQYPGIVKAPGKVRIFVDAIDAAVDAQRSTRPAVQPRRP